MTERNPQAASGAASPGARDAETLRRRFDELAAGRAAALESVYRAWQTGSPDVPPAFRRALGRRADELRDLGLDGYDPLAL